MYQAREDGKTAPLAHNRMRTHAVYRKRQGAKPAEASSKQIRGKTTDMQKRPPFAKHPLFARSKHGHDRVDDFIDRGKRAARHIAASEFSHARAH